MKKHMNITQVSGGSKGHSLTWPIGAAKDKARKAGKRQNHEGLGRKN